MIGKLSGRLDSRGEDWVIVDCQGVGYVVFCSARTLSSVPSDGEAISLAIETHVREDMIRLFGFQSDAERDWFRLLNTVQGVGAKVALAILSTLSAGDLASAVAMQDKAMVARAQGVGPKVAQRIVSELKDKAPAMAGVAAPATGLGAALANEAASPAADAVSALVNLGYGQTEAGLAIQAAAKAAGDAPSAETLIRLGLKELAR
ncbi:MAG: Holliday junction branch migration protein RuvA [Pseudomonadota bacterium]